MTETKRLIYADHAATSPVSPAVLEAMMPFLTGSFGNPSSIHSAGMEAVRAVLSARTAVAQALGAERPGEIYFTSGGTESDNWAVRGAAQLGAEQGRRHIVTTLIEHPAVLNTCRYLEGRGFEVTYLRPDSLGLISPEEVSAALREDTCLVSVMAANNEVGTLQPLGEISEICQERGVLLHTDAVQFIGQLEFDLRKTPVDLLSLSGHKLRGPKGIGALYCRSSLRLPPLIFGGGQERGRRAGTENVPGIAGLGAAVTEAVRDIPARSARLRELRDALARELSAVPAGRINGHMEKRLPGNLNMSFEGVEGETLLMLLSREGVCASSGSACASGSTEPSHVLTAMGLSHDLARGSLRLTLGEETTYEDIACLARVIPDCIARVRAVTGWRMD